MEWNNLTSSTIRMRWNVNQFATETFIINEAFDLKCCRKNKKIAFKFCKRWDNALNTFFFTKEKVCLKSCFSVSETFSTSRNSLHFFLHCLSWKDKREKRIFNSTSQNKNNFFFFRLIFLERKFPSESLSCISQEM